MNNISNATYMVKTRVFDDGVLPHRKFVADKEHLYSELNGEAVILSLKNGKYYGVNAVGAVIWTLIQNPATFQDIQTKLMSEYDVDETTCRREVLSFLEKMAKDDLIKVVNEKTV